MRRMTKQITKKPLRIFFLTILFCAIANHASAQQVTISNNLLYDVALTPNLRVGLRLSDKWSMGLTAGYRPWPTDETKTRKWKHLLVSPSVRYWTDSVNVHHFFGANIIYSHYNIADIKFPFGMYKSVRNERRQGDLIALGVFYGYSWPLGRFWNIEPFIGVAVGYTWYNRYECGHCGEKIGRDHKWFAMPQAGINIVYNIPGRPKRVPRAVIVDPPYINHPPTTPDTIFDPIVRNVPENTGRAGQLQKDNPVLAHISEYKPYDRTQILRKDKNALFVHFPKAKHELRGDFRNNQATLDRIVDLTRQVMADNTSSVKKIQIVGLASIEGNPDFNETLATNRAMALQRYLQQQVAVPDDLFDTVGGGEAWSEFRDQLTEYVANDSQHAKELQQALSIIDNESNVKVREKKLRQLNGGRTWKYITDNILSDQRNSGYVRIYYDYVPDNNAKIINEANELLTADCTDCHHEALRLLQQVRDDERAQNALGVALWFCGQKEEAIDRFRRAAANGNEDAKTNLRELKIE